MVFHCVIFQKQENYLWDHFQRNVKLSITSSWPPWAYILFITQAPPASWAEPQPSSHWWYEDHELDRILYQSKGMWFRAYLLRSSLFYISRWQYLQVLPFKSLLSTKMQKKKKRQEKKINGGIWQKNKFSAWTQDWGTVGFCLWVINPK